MFIADIAFERPDAPETKRWVRFGSLWADGSSARLKLSGFYLGSFAGLLKDGKNPEYVAGDLIYRGALVDAGKYDEQWIGHIQTSEKDDRVVYFGEIMVVPVVTQEKAWVMVKE
jgi:hypothetical protein